MKLVQMLIKLCPEKMRHRLIRRMVKTPDHSDNKIIYKIASTQQELEAAFRLLHDCYATTGFIAPQPHGLRCNLYSILPNTTVVIAKKDDEVIGTVSLIRDSSLGFPCDKEFKKENDSYRAQGAQMVEVSALAVSPAYRKTKHSSQVSLYLMKYLYEYTSKHMGCDTLCVAVHPKTYDFYKGLMNFRRNGKMVKYNFVRGALAIHMTTNMNVFRSEWAAQNYANEPTNVGNFLNSPCPDFMEFPKMESGLLLNPVITKDMLQYFAIDKTNLTDELESFDLDSVKSAYQIHFDTSFIEGFLPTSKTAKSRAFRYPARISARLISGNKLMVGTLSDVSPEGAFFMTEEILDLETPCTLIFQLSTGAVKIKASIRWMNRKNNLRSGPGFGIAFDKPNSSIEAEIRKCHLNYKQVG